MNSFTVIKMTGAKILIVDDQQANVELLEMMLKMAGYWNVTGITDPRLVQNLHREHRFDLILLDLRMPDMDGYQVMEELSELIENDYLPVLVLTAEKEQKARMKSFKLGAKDFITKPFNTEETLNRIKNMLEVRLLHNQLSQFHDRLTIELAYAVDLQMELIPTQTEIQKINEKYGVQIASHFRQSSELGGDAWFLQSIDENRFGIIIVDFSGHGIPAAMNTFRLHTIINRLGVCTTSPADYLEAINNELAEVLPVEHYCTMLYAMVDVKNDTIIYSGACAPAPIYGCLGGGDISLGEGSGLPIGAIPKSKYENHRIEFPKSSYLFLYSDALYETELGENGPLESDGIVSLVKQYISSDARVALDDILSDFLKRAPDPLPDDLTAIWLSR